MQPADSVPLSRELQSESIVKFVLPTKKTITVIRSIFCILVSVYGYVQTVTCVAVSPDGRYFAGAVSDCTVRLYELSTGKVCISSEKITKMKAFAALIIISEIFFIPATRFKVINAN